MSRNSILAEEIAWLRGFGWRPEQIARRLGCEPRTVEKYVGEDVGAAIAREETAAIYSRTVPEHNSNAAPLPPCATSWEKARLSGATRHLTTVQRLEETA